MFNYYKRIFNSTIDNRPFNDGTKLLVWNKARPVPGYTHLSNEWRIDKCGALIQFSKYGDTISLHGWEIDHINPVSKGGSDMLWNLQPLQWENNRYKGDSVGAWACKIKSTT